VRGLPPEARLHAATNRGWTLTDRLLALAVGVPQPGADTPSPSTPLPAQRRPANAREAFLRFMGHGR
jgi:hypothetical protein